MSFVLAMATCSVIVATQVNALGLGKLRVQSALDQPLVAEIELQSLAPEELESLAVSLGSREDFQRAGLVRGDFLEQLQFAVSSDQKVAVVRVTTRQPVKEPYLQFVLAARWQGGKLLRGYTALLDPPLYAAALSRPTSGVPVALQQESSQATVVALASTGHTSVNTALKSERMTTRYGPTRPGDNLWNIALAMGGYEADGSVYQVMSALLRDNPGAFDDGNMHRLRTGQLLRLDDFESVQEFDAGRAEGVYRQQLAEWRYGVTAPDGAAGNRPQPRPERTPVPASEPVREMADSSLPAAVTVALDLTYKGIDQRVQQLEGQVQANTRRLDEIESFLTVSLQRNVAIGGVVPAIDTAANDQPAATSPDPVSEPQDSAPASDTGSTTVAAAEPDDSVTPAEGPPAASEIVAETAPAASGQDAAEASPAPAPVTGTALASSTSARIAGGATRAESERSTAEPAARVSPTAKTASGPGAPIKGMLARVEQYGALPWLLAGCIAVIVLLAGLVVYRRRRRTEVKFDESLLKGAMAAPSEITDLDDSTSLDLQTTDQTITEEIERLGLELGGRSGTFTSNLQDFESPGSISVQANNVDTLAEAEIYLAYGREELAENVLKSAIVEEPERHELRLRLLQIYKKQKNIEAFETVAEELYPMVAQQDPVLWRQVANMGRELDPNNVLYGGGGDDSDLVTDEAEKVAMELPDESIAPFPEPIPVFDDEFENQGDHADPEQARAADLLAVADRVPDPGKAVLQSGSDRSTPAETDFSLDLDEDTVTGAATVDYQDMDIEVEDLRQQMAALEENLSERNHENQQLRDRVGSLEAQALEVAPLPHEDLGFDIGGEKVVVPETEHWATVADQSAEADTIPALQMQITALERALRAQERENRELRNRVNRLEQQVQTIVLQLGDEGDPIDAPEASGVKLGNAS